MVGLSPSAAPSASPSSTAPGHRRRRRDDPFDSVSRSRSLSLESAASEMHHPPPRSSLAMLSSSAAAAAAAAVVGCGSPSVATFGPLAADEAHRCRYKTGKCRNARSSKRNGQPHQLCLYHRDKANQIQRKFDRQKRQVLRERKSSGCASSSALTASSSSLSSTSATQAHRGHLQQLQYMQPQNQRRSPPTASAMLSNYPPQHHHSSSSSSRMSSSVHNITNFAPRFTSLAAKDVDLYSDSEHSSRFSTDSSSSDSSSLWADLPSPVSAAAFMGLRLALSPASTSTRVVSSPAVSSPTLVGVTPTSTSSLTSPHPLSRDEIDFLCSAMFE